jgi:hypothetical protein
MLDGLKFQMCPNFIQCDAIVIHKLSIRSFVTAERLSSACGTTSHRTIGIGLALQAPIKVNHHERKGETLWMVFLESYNPINEFSPIIAS